MSIADELERLQALHGRGALTDAEFQAAKARLLEPPRPGVRRLSRTRRGAWLAGVCAGLAMFTSTPAWLWRLGFLVFAPVAGFSLLLYTLMAIFIPIEH